MKVVVSTPTGNIGRVVADRLLDAGTELTLIARDPEKVRDLAARGATVLQGTLEDGEFVVNATRGADVLFWVTPPNYGAEDLRAFQNALGKNAAAAVKANGIDRVIDVSSVAAQLDSGTGPILGVSDNEKHLNAVAENVTHLRPNMFMENVLNNVETIKTAKSLFLPVSGSAGARFIATRDIAEYAAKRILDTSWTGRHVIELSGPAWLSFDEIAEGLSAALGETISHVQVPAEQAREALIGMGLSADVAAGLLDVYASADKGRLEPEQPLTAENTMKTTFAEFARDVIVPNIRGAAPVS